MRPTCFANEGNWKDWFFLNPVGLWECIPCGATFESENEAKRHLGLEV